MRRINTTITGKLYEVKRQYPSVHQFLKRMETVKKELNKDTSKR